MALLELRGVAKRFPSARGTRQVLVDVDLAVEEGELVTVVGRSGSGKSTLLAIAAGLVCPDGGEVLLAGRPVAGPGPDRGIVFQGDSLLPWMTVLENVELAAAAVAPGRSRAEHRDRALHFLALVGLEAALGKRPAELSGGMRQRVAVARGLATEPRVLLLDEPFSALDALTRATLQAEVARIWTERRTTVVMITNDLDEAILLGDRICPLVPTAPGEGSTIALDLPIDVPRPRSARTLSLDPGYQAVRRRLVDFLVHRRARPAGGAAAPPRPAAAPAALPAAESPR